MRVAARKRCLGALAAHPECAARLSQSRVLSALYSIITEKQDDDEIVLQILYAFFHLLQANEPRFALLQQTQLVVYLLDLLLDKNEAVRRMADLCLDVVIEKDDTWASQIRQRKFQMHNKEWLEVVDEDEAEEYQDAVALNNAMASLHHQQPLDASALDDAGDLDDSYDVAATPGTCDYSDVAGGAYAAATAGYGADDHYGGSYGRVGVGDPYGASDDYSAGLATGAGRGAADNLYGGYYDGVRACPVLTDHPCFAHALKIPGAHAHGSPASIMAVSVSVSVPVPALL